LMKVLMIMGYQGLRTTREGFVMTMGAQLLDFYLVVCCIEISTFCFFLDLDSCFVKN